MHMLILFTYAGLASALLPPCLPHLGPEFCPSSQVLRRGEGPHARYDEYRKEDPAIFPNSITQVMNLLPLVPLESLCVHKTSLGR